MAAKKKRAAPARRAKRKDGEGETAAEALLTMIAAHESTIRKLAEVVVNLHANVQALRGVVEPLAETSRDPAVTRSLRALRRVTLDE